MNTEEPESAEEHCLSELEPSMSSVQIEQKSYEMPPRDGLTVTHFITVADIDRSADFYEKVFGGRILSRGDSKGASGHIQIANTWLIVNVGGGPTPDKDKVSSFLNIRVADIQARAMNYGKVEEPSSSRSRRKSTADSLLHPFARWQARLNISAPNERATRSKLCLPNSSNRRSCAECGCDDCGTSLSSSTSRQRFKT
jgi:hypothetical protein